MKIKLITLGLHFNQVKIKNFNHRQSAGKLTFTWTNHAGPNRALYITILVLLFSAIQKQRNQLLAFVFLMDRWLNSCNCCCHLEGMKWLSATITTSAICMVTSTSRSHHPRGFFWAAAGNEETNLQYGSWRIRCWNCATKLTILSCLSAAKVFAIGLYRLAHRNSSNNWPDLQCW